MDLETLLSKTEALVSKMYVVKSNYSLRPSRDHIATFINFSDMIEMRPEFIKELLSTITQFVYSSSKRDELKQKFQNEGRESDAASSMLFFHSRSKFRKGNLRGQLSELLLFNLLQHHFKAVPLVRKMQITTNPGVERNGADAIHIAKENGEYVLYLGEAKTYGGGQNKTVTELKNVVKEALESIYEHYTNHRNELTLYTYDDFIPSELEKIAQEYLEGKRNEMAVNLVCLMTYDYRDDHIGANQKEITKSICGMIEDHTRKISETQYQVIPEPILARVNYIIFPVKQLDDLINVFSKLLGEPA